MRYDRLLKSHRSVDDPLLGVGVYVTQKKTTVVKWRCGIGRAWSTTLRRGHGRTGSNSGTGRGSSAEVTLDADQLEFVERHSERHDAVNVDLFVCITTV